MKLESQVCTLAQAKRLGELGVSQQSLFVWVFNANHKADRSPTHHLLPDITSGLCRQAGYDHKERTANQALSRGTDYAAFTSAELGEMLGSDFVSRVESGITRHSWQCLSEGWETPLIAGESEAQARAAMLIWFLEQKLRTAAETNTALAAA